MGSYSTYISCVTNLLHVCRLFITYKRADHIYAQTELIHFTMTVQIKINNLLSLERLIIASSLNIYIESYAGNNFIINSMNLKFANCQVYIVKVYLHL